MIYLLFRINAKEAGTGASSNYKKRYKYNGNFSVSYASQKSGNRDLDNYTDIKNFSLTGNIIKIQKQI